MGKLEDNIVKEIIALYKDGGSIIKIAKRLKISKSTVSKYINNVGLSKYESPIEITGELLEKLQKDYDSGSPKKVIGKKYRIALYRLNKLIKPKALTKYEVLKNRRIRIKEEFINYKGGKCSICGYSKCYSALEFHHLNPSEKDFTIAQNSSYKNMKILKKELDKCILVCANCHREIHAGLIKI